MHKKGGDDMPADYHKDVIMKQLEVAFRVAGKKLTEQEVKRKKDLPNPAEYASYYGTYDAAADFVWRGLNPSKVIKDDNSPFTPLAKGLIAKLQKQAAEQKEQEKKNSS